MRLELLLRSIACLRGAMLNLSVEASTVVCTGGPSSTFPTRVGIQGGPLLPPPDVLCPPASTASGKVRKITLGLDLTLPQPNAFSVNMSEGVSWNTFEPYWIGRDVGVMADAGGSSAFAGSITLDDDADVALPVDALVNGMHYRPAHYDGSAALNAFADVYGTMARNQGDGSGTFLFLNAPQGSGASVTHFDLRIDYTALPYACVLDHSSSILWQNVELGLVQPMAAFPTNTLMLQQPPLLQPSVAALNVDGAWTPGPSGDFDGNGYGDLTWIRANTGDVQLWMMDTPTIDGNGTYQPIIKNVATYNVQAPWRLVTTGHFYARNIWDLVWVNPSLNTMQIWFLADDGSGGVANAVNYEFGPGWTLKGAGDFRRRGQHDLLWLGPGVAQVWTMDGPSVIAATNFDMPAGWDVGGIADLDGDGVDDIVWVNRDEGVGQVWLMDGGSVRYAWNFALPANDWTLIDVRPFFLYPSYLNRGSLLWYNASRQALQIWSMGNQGSPNFPDTSVGFGWFYTFFMPPGWVPH
jgi:hypothetical protein